MYVISVQNAVIGQIIAEPILSPSGVLLCNPGTPVSNTLKKSLPKFGITSIPIKSIVGNAFDDAYLNFQTINNMAYMSIKHLDIDDIARCASVLVNSLRTDESSLLLNMLYDYDEGTYIHSMNVASLSLTCAIKLGFRLRELYLLSLGSLVHDIGKTKIDINIINKNGKLSDEEYKEMRKHPEYGCDILNEEGEAIPSAVKQIVLQHHENHDGTGYPRKLKDFHIYKLARLVHIADCYEALCAKRPYKDALPRAMVREFMITKAENMFDPIMLRKFLSIIPMYLIGEEIEYNGVRGVIIDMADGANPLVSVGKDIVRLSDFQSDKYTKQKVFSDCRELIFV